MTHDFAAAIADRLSVVFETLCGITDLALLTGGASGETWRFTVTSGDRSEELILR